jgi:hypothetical protein
MHMKTQLLQDFQESGSADAAPKPADPPPPAPARPPRPAVWHGPGARREPAGAAVQRADPGPMQRGPDTPARGLGVAIEAWAERAAQQRPEPPPPPPPAPPPPGEATVPGQHARTSHVPPPRPPEPPPAPPPQPRIDPDTLPRPTQAEAEADWLAARLRLDAAQRDAPAWSSLWKRRLVTWSIAGGLLAALAAGGLWLYEENRVEGALVVVANTSPAPAAAPSGAQAFPTGSAAAVPPAPAVPATPAPPAADDAVKPPPQQPGPDVAAAPPSVADATPSVDARTVVPVDVNPPRRTARHASTARKHAAAKPRRARTQDEQPAAATPSPRQRREETLMQCRAHGYDERQCIQRACTMTRYGLACKG